MTTTPHEGDMSAPRLDDRKGCATPSIYDALTAYSFDDLTGEDRERVAAHLIECDHCWHEVQRLEACVAALRRDPQLKPLVPSPEVFAVLGLSGRLEQPFGGHRAFVWPIAALYGLLYVAALWTELSYSFDRYGRLVWLLSPVAGFGAAAAILSALALDARTSSQRAAGLGRPILCAITVLGLVTVLLSFLLPSIPTIDAAFQTRSAAAGYQKNVIYYFLPLLLFLLPTFHTVLALQRELRAGRHRAVLDLLSGSGDAVAPRGVWFVPMWLLLAVLLLAAGIGYQGTSYLLDHLTPGPYANLFSIALYIRVALWYVIALTCLGWYQRSLNELKREALAVNRLVSEPRK